MRRYKGTGVHFMAVFKRLPGKARRYVDVETGREYSRYAVERVRGRQQKKWSREQRYKYNQYRQIIDRYIHVEEQDGKRTLTKKQAREEVKKKKIVEDIKSDNLYIKRKALAKITTLDRFRELYIQNKTEG